MRDVKEHSGLSDVGMLGIGHLFNKGEQNNTVPNQALIIKMLFPAAN